MGLATGKNFIIDPRVRSSVTMLSSTPMSPEAYRKGILAILEVHGYRRGAVGKPQ